MSFKENLKTWVTELFTTYKYSHEEKAFSHFYIKQFRDDQSFSDHEIRKHIVDNANDLGIDALYVNNTQDSVIFIQSKYSYNDAMLDPEIEKTDSFLSNYLELLGGSRSNLIKDANRDLKHILETEVFPIDPENIYFIYLCGSFSPVISSRINNLSEKYKDNNVFFERINIDNLESLFDPYHVSNVCPVEFIPNQIYPFTKSTIFLDSGKSIDVQSCVFSAKAESLKSLYQNIGDALFEANVRNFLTFRKPVNRAIRIEIEKASKSNFWFYNNGIVAVCEGFDKTETQIIAKNMQIVNGGQTVRSINAVTYIDPQLSVNCKLISIERAAEIPVDTKREFITNLAMNSNRQNPISSRDLHSNDEIQRQLQERFRSCGIFYQIKAGEEKVEPWKKKLKKEGYSLLNSAAANSVISLFLQKPHSSGGRTALAFLTSNEGDDVINYESIFGSIRADTDSVFKRLMLSWLLSSQVEEMRSLPEMQEFTFLYYAQNIILSLFGYWFFLSFNSSERSKIYDEGIVRYNLLSANYYDSIMSMTGNTYTLGKMDSLKSFFDFVVDKIHDYLSDRGIEAQPRAISNLFKKETTLKDISERIRPKLILKKLLYTV